MVGQKGLWRILVPRDLVLALFLNKFDSLQDIRDIINATLLNTQFARSNIKIQNIPRRPDQKLDELLCEQTQRRVVPRLI
jgi:hypothetical protein